jgi:hypothetical protein
LPLLAAYFGASLLGWLAATVALLVAAAHLAAGDLGAAAPVLAVHLLAFGFLPLAVSGGSFHLLPVMLSNPLRSERRLWAALPLLAVGGWLVAPGVAFDASTALWSGAALLACGLALVLVELGGLVARAPRGRMLVASRAGIALSLFRALACGMPNSVRAPRNQRFAGRTLILAPHTPRAARARDLTSHPDRYRQARVAATVLARAGRRPA